MNSLDELKVPNVQCTQYLIDGKITNWSGPSAEVFSNIYLSKNKHGEPGPTLIGNVPDLGRRCFYKSFRCSSKCIFKRPRKMANYES
jgi:hypothetical protein